MSDAVSRQPLDDGAASGRAAGSGASKKPAHDPLVQRDWPLDQTVSAATLIRLQYLKVVTGFAALLLLAAIWIFWRLG